MSSPNLPWSPYLGREGISSAGRVTLIEAFGQVVESQQDFPPYELPEIFAAPTDDGENDTCRDLVRLEAEALCHAFAHGHIATYVRPLGGGQVEPLTPASWEIDDPLPRVASGLMNLNDWANADASPTHRIFVDADQFNRWLAGLPAPGPLSAKQAEEVADPQLRAARAIARQNNPAGASTEATEKVQFHASDPPGVGPVLLSMKQLEKKVGLKNSTIYAKIKSDGFPEAIKLGKRSLWSEPEVEEWLRGKAAKRGN